MDVSTRAVAQSKRLRATISAPRLSVVLVNYVHWDDTARLVQQLRQSEAFDHEAEVVVVDNHSPPHPIIRHLRRAPGVSLRRWGSNRGFARAVNEGCRLAMGDWLLLLNPDTSVPDGFLDSVLDRAEDLFCHHPQAGIVGFRLTNSDGSPQLSTGRFPTLASTLLGRLWPRHARKYTPPSHPGRVEVDWVTGCCLLIRRECWDDLAGLDTRFFLYYEDVDLCHRARQRGWSVWYDPTVTITHHRPLHTRQVPPHLHLITRHALLSYAHKHWSRWQAGVMNWVVRCESYASSEELRHIATDLRNGNQRAALAHIRRAVRRYEEGQQGASLDRDPIAQPARLAGGVPVQRAATCPVGDGDPCHR